MNPAIILFFGDSIVAGTGDTRGAGWPGRIVAAARMNGSEVVAYNLGINGDTATGIAARWPGEYRLRCPDGLAAATVFGFGLNDATREEDGTVRVECEASVQAAIGMIEPAKRLGPVLWIGPTPIDETTQPYRSSTGLLRTKNNALTAEYNDAYRHAAADMSVPYLDLFNGLSADPCWLGTLVDGIHPGGAGYDRLAEDIGNWHAWRTLIGQS